LLLLADELLLLMVNWGVGKVGDVSLVRIQMFIWVPIRIHF
jgi:hypothetical protein